MAVTTKGPTSASFASAGRDAATAELAKPSALPPGAEAKNGGVEATAPAVPLTLSDEELTRMLGSNSALASPTAEPPAQKAGLAAEGVTAAVWKSGHVNALWTINQNRNTWAGFDNSIGWQKFSDVSDSAAMAFTILASNARDSQGSTSFRSDTTDNKVHEIYVW